MAQELFSGSWSTKLERMATALRSAHKSLIDSTQRDYEKLHGRITNPYALFTLVAQDPAFAWLQPMTHLIVEIEDVLSRKSPPVVQEDFLRAQGEIRRLVGAEGEHFAEAYRARVQSDPRVAVEHGRLHVML